eukprot:TRINITY_DN26230_c0_g1_i2.p2 TRINITY_DN26230_c0_g1~~TRINITY_DN26230_c0_g1_i2.p2  ORF type:complete len:232 (-),score=55.82 TRINITY_DN26230_c0_g1_i2:51-746(-)
MCIRDRYQRRVHGKEKYFMKPLSSSKSLCNFDEETELTRAAEEEKVLYQVMINLKLSDLELAERQQQLNELKSACSLLSGKLEEASKRKKELEAEEVWPSDAESEALRAQQDSIHSRHRNLSSIFSMLKWKETRADVEKLKTLLEEGKTLKKSIEQLRKDAQVKKTEDCDLKEIERQYQKDKNEPVSYTHLRAHETSLHLVCRLLLEKKKKNKTSKQQRRSKGLFQSTATN